MNSTSLSTQGGLFRGSRDLCKDHGALSLVSKDFRTPLALTREWEHYR
jgi:hypothetical protein